MKDYRRTRFFTNIKYQLKFSLVIVFFMALISLVVGATVYFDLSRVITYAETAGLIRWESYIVRAVVILLAAFAAGIFFSHKIIGPVQRLKEALRRIGDGDFDVSVTLRAGDEFMDMSRQINRLSEKLRKASEKYPGLPREIKGESEESGEPSAESANSPNPSTGS